MEKEKRRLSTRLMCWHTVTLRLNLNLFPFFFILYLEAKARGEFTALQLLALVTVNWRRSEAVTVFYGALLVPGLCQGSHLWGEQSYWWPRPPRLTSPQNSSKPQALDYCWWHFSVPLAPLPSLSLSLSPPALLSLPYLSVYFLPPPLCHGTDRQSDCSSVNCRPGSPVLLIYERRLCARRFLGDKRLVPFAKYYWFPPQREEDVYGRNKKKKGFSNNLRKLQKTLFTMLRQSCTEEIFFFVCVSL